MIKIYYWKYMPPNRLPSVSMELSDGTYISCWKTCSKQSLQDDIDYEERPPDNTISFPAGYLNENSTRDWWSNFKESGGFNVSIFSDSAHVVREALRSGLRDITERKPYLKLKVAWKFMTSPEDIFRRATYIVWYLNNLKVTKIYFWEIRALEKSVGHISMELSDGTYISHWPEEHKLRDYGIRGTPTSPKLSLQEDITEEKRPPDEVLDFPKEFLNEALIKEWWENFIKSGNYNLATSNCAHIVSQALKVGIAANLAELVLLQFGLEKKMDWSLLKKPADAFSAAKIVHKVFIENLNDCIEIKDYKEISI